MQTTKKKASTMKLDNLFTAQDMREISSAIFEGIKKASSKKKKQILQALKR